VTTLPTPAEAQRWTVEQWVSALRHDLDSPDYNRSLRQLMHVAFKIAAKMGQRYIAMLEQNEDCVAQNVTRNLFDRHIRPVFIGPKSVVHGAQSENAAESARH
jgi:tagaturonate epimerase